MLDYIDGAKQYEQGRCKTNNYCVCRAKGHVENGTEEVNAGHIGTHETTSHFAVIVLNIIDKIKASKTVRSIWNHTAVSIVSGSKYWQ